MWPIRYLVNNFVSRHRGTLPVLLSCPHDGDGHPPDVLDERTGEGLPPGCNFSTDSDLNTRTITIGVAQRMLDIYGEAPYVVIADFNRDYIDANRDDADFTPNCAYEDPNAKPYYDEYHSTIRDFITEIRAENGGLGLLFDIHGTKGIDAAPADIYLGTDDGKTIKRLLGVDPETPGRSGYLSTLLIAAGYDVLPKPPDVSLPPEAQSLGGGFTVEKFGSSHPDGLDAIQLEIGKRLRDISEVREQFIDHLAHGIGSLIARYADTHTLAAFRSVDLYGGDTTPLVPGRLQRRDTTHDVRLRLGGISLNRGRVEIRHDPGITGEPTAPSRAGILVLYDENGRDYYLWVDKQGKLRISGTDPGDISNAGTIVGTQT